MSVEVSHGGQEHAHGHGDPELIHQYEDMVQQNESYTVGMWSFLVTEVMFFGALFLAYAIYRSANPGAYYSLSKSSLNVPVGAINTMVLLFSSWCMAMAVHGAQKKRQAQQLISMGITIICAFVFLILKFSLEWSVKIKEHHVPGPDFLYINPHPDQFPFVQQNQAQMFFSLYFAMTGLHAIHVIIGILIMGLMWFMIKFKHPAMKYYMWMEMIGLYWHFVDIVWIFLFPLFYLIPKP